MSDRAVVTVTLGEHYQKLAPLTHPRLQAYARKTGADFVIIDRPQVADPGHFEKFQIYNLFDKYARVLFLDTDVLIQEDCPDLFRMVPSDHFGAYFVSQHSSLHDLSVSLAQQALGQIGWDRRYFNSGVFICSKEHRELFNFKNEEFNQWLTSCKTSKHFLYLDQGLLNYRVQKLVKKQFDLGYTFNHTTAPKNSSERFRSHIIHYPGKGHRLRGDRYRQIRLDAAILQNPTLLNWAKRCPWLVKLTDLF